MQFRARLAGWPARNTLIQMPAAFEIGRAEASGGQDFCRFIRHPIATRRSPRECIAAVMAAGDIAIGVAPIVAFGLYGCRSRMRPKRGVES